MVVSHTKLSGITHQADELMKENVNLKSKVAALHEHMDKVKKEAVEEFRVSQPYFNEMGITTGTALRASVSKLSLCSQIWTFPRFKSSLMP